MFWRRLALDRLRFSAKHFGKKPLLIILASVVFAASALIGTTLGQASKAEKERVVREVATNWIKIGTEQFNRGFYSAAEQSFLRAKDYEEYLTEEEKASLKESIEKSHKAALERNTVLEVISTAKGLAEQDKLLHAKAQLETIAASEFLTAEERQTVKERLDEVSKQLEQRKKEVSELYTQSVEYYRAGELAKAREGFIKIARSDLLVTAAGESPQDYLVKIDNAMSGKAEEPKAAVVAETKPEEPKKVESAEEKAAKIEIKRAADSTPAPSAAAVTPAAPAVTAAAVSAQDFAEPAQGGDGYINEINRRRSVIRGRVKAVVSDANTKAQECIGKNEFEKAKEAVEGAERIVYENQVQLGDYLFKEYTGQLKLLSERIAEGQKAQSQQREEEKRVRAEEAQQEYKGRMEVERAKRIANLLDNAHNFQRQQRYEEAKGQLELLLAIDPQNDEALILKRTLEDTISFRQQLEVRREKDKERVNIIVKTEESTIPYADEMTHPKNWREIVAKPTRQPEEAIGQDPANAATEKELDEIVNLTELSPEMPLSEGIRVLQNSVDPPLKISVNWGDLSNNAQIDQTTPINMDPLSGVRLRAALDLLLESVSAGGATKLGYIVKDGVVTVATQQSLPSKLEARVYDVTILVGRPADYYASSSGTGGGGGGGMGGGGGGMGGGGMGGGGMGGGGGGGMGGYYMEYFEEQEEELDRETLREEAAQRMDNLVLLIQDTVNPVSWYERGGQGTITPYENKKLIVLQTPESHREIVKLLQEMRKALGHQVAIEARFLVVGENFLEEIGLDVIAQSLSGGQVDSQWQMGSFEAAAPKTTDVPGSWDFGDVEFPQGSATTYQGGAMLGTFTLGAGILDGLQATFLIRASQAHRDSESLVAPKATVLSGESATLQVRRTLRYMLPPNVSGGGGGAGGAGGVGGGFGGGSQGLQNQISMVPTGPTLNITPTITPDKKHVLLNIVAELWDFLGWYDQTIQAAIPATATVPASVISYNVKLPQTERSRVKTRVSVPDGGTLLLGGLKRTAGVENEVGVPILSKIPVVGRVFTNRSTVKDQKILLILVKPTIILQEEADAEAIAAMEGGL